MRDDIDIEDALRRYRCEPSAKVKQTVLSRFRGARDVRGPGRPVASFWRKPVPLYLAGAALAILAAMSFAAGRKTAPTDTGASPTGAASQEKNVLTSEKIGWTAAERDIL